ncbi:MAG TPA: hypothetical protein VK983_03945 [Candidatus Limnocylindrales bacterium]|nr:hypothetical protein [Candidatus Limnocylindrales bacterium]
MTAQLNLDPSFQAFTKDLSTMPEAHGLGNTLTFDPAAAPGYDILIQEGTVMTTNPGNLVKPISAALAHELDQLDRVLWQFGNDAALDDILYVPLQGGHSQPASSLVDFDVPTQASASTSESHTLPE